MIEESNMDNQQPPSNTPAARSLSWMPATPQEESLRELSQRIAFTPDMNLGFFGKLSTAFSNETVSGNLLDRMAGPGYADTGYIVTGLDIRKYAGDIDPRSASRAAASSDSFAEFLYETDRIRNTEKKRKELFSGGLAGQLTGFGLTMLAAGSEAVALSLLAGAGGAAMGVGRVAGAAASATTAVTRVNRIRGAIKASGTALAIDVPLEATRYALDKTLRPADIIMALGASGGLSASLGAWKPHFFIRELQGASDVAATRTAAAALRETGQDTAAARLEDAVRVSVRIVESDSEAARVAGLRGTELYDEARKLGVQTHIKNSEGVMRHRPIKEIREEILNKQPKKRTASPTQVEAQVLREVKGLGRTALVAMAKRVGARTTGATENIINSIVKKRIQAARTGKVTKTDPPRLPAGLDLRKTVSSKEGTIQLEGTFERVLWKLGTARKKDTEQLNELRKALRERGFEDPDAIAKDFVKRTKAARKLESNEKPFTANAVKLQTEGASRTLEDGTAVRGFVRETDYDTRVDSDILGVADEDVVVAIDGNPTVEVPAEFADDIVDLTPTKAVPRRGMTTHSDGLRETIARGIDYLGGDLMAYFFMPNSYRMLRSSNPEVRRFAEEFMTMGREGNHNVSLKARVAFDRFVGKVRRDINKARQAAWEQGEKLTDLDIIRGVRSGEKFDGPIGDAVEAVRTHFREVKRYGTDRGMPLDSIPDDLRYVTRRYNHSAFTKLIARLGAEGKNGESEAIRIFKQAILNHPDAAARGVTEAKAEAASRRIVNWGKSPDEVMDVKETRVRLDKIRKELIDDGIPEEEVDSFLELVSPKINTEPHLSFAKRRIEMDENYVDPQTGISIDEFFNNNLTELLGRYTKQIVGGAETRVGLQKLFGDADISRSALKDKILKAGDLSEKEAARVTRTIDRVMREIGGQPIHPGTSRETMKLIYGANAFSQATIGMTLGFAQITEIASLVCRNGIRSAFEQLPSLKELAKIFTMGFRDLRTGRQGLGLEGLDDIDDLGAMIDTYTGIAGDYARGDHFTRVIDDAGFDGDYIKGNSMRYLNYGQQVSFLNPLGIMPMDTFLRRWAGRAAFQNFVNMTFKADADGIVRISSTAWDNQKVRLKQIGLDEDDLNRLKKAFEQPGAITFKKGVFGDYKVKTFNPKAFNDEFIFQKFALSLRKHVDSTIQRQSYGELPEFWTTPVGKLIGQYRVFMIASKTKQLAAGVARGDATEAANIVGACGLGTLAYYLQTYYRSASMDSNKRETYLKERLSTDYLLKAGAMKSPYSTVFPMLIDSATSMVGGEPFFDPSMRTTGLGIDPLRGSVPYSVLYNRILPAGREITGALFRGDEISKQDLRNDQALLWFTKIPGVDQAVNQLGINPLNIPEKD